MSMSLCLHWVQSYRHILVRMKPFLDLTTSGTKNNGTYKAQSNCTHDYDFSIASCLKLSDNNPCSNRPVECELCENAVEWSYCLNLHYSLLHQVPLM